MNRTLVVSVFGGFVLLLWLLAWAVLGSAERSPEVVTGDLMTHPDQVKRPVVDAIFRAFGPPALKAEREEENK